MQTQNLLRGRSLINILLLTLGFIFFFFLFTVIVLIPAGKSYKKDHKSYIQQRYLESQAQQRHNKVSENLNDLQSKNKSIIMAYENLFNPKGFDRDYGKFFKRLKLSAVAPLEKEQMFDVYEVNTSSDIATPSDFYEFLTAVNKSENIISIEFPIHFKASGNVIEASFRMKVYTAVLKSYLKDLQNIEANTSREEVGTQF